ncbi:MAG: ABC transporter ATP-binding protein [Coriobacteriales bacterium]|jgi:NitT/TauT family transport system ATP-binding protein/sulfonate transport system ATP-binding protein|nr:ABC transporter ATP-binding protein [Coriobacteriales bacterium]
MTRPTLIDIRHVTRVYRADDGSETHALDDVSLEVREGEFVSLIGPSGCGKTTLLRLVAGLDSPQAGSLTVEGRPIEAPGPDRGYVFQQGALYPWATVAENIATGLKARGVYRTERHRVPQFIELVGLSGFDNAYPHQVSGGMAQRVAIARALINGPRALLLDEPMGALDSFTRIELQDKLLDLWKDLGSTMLLVTHDVDEAICLSDRIVVMTPRPGRISEVIEVALGRPRLRNDPDFLALRSSILEKLHLAGSRPEPEFNI